MKCHKCGSQVNENDDFCSSCGEKINKEIKTDTTKTKKKLFIIFIIEIILVILMAIGINNYYRNNFDNKIISQNEFKEILTQDGYALKDAKEEGSTGIKSYDFATVASQDLGIHYIVADNNKNSINVFNNLYSQIKSQSKSGFINERSIDLIDYNYYSLENGGDYYVVARNGDTVLAATGVSKYKNEINDMVKEFGFSYPSSILYVITVIVILIFILMIVVMWKIFVKSGRKGWQSLIPLYNYYCLSKITFNKGWLFILLLITPINFVFMLVIFYKLAKRFGKSTAFAVCSIFFPYITMQMIAFDKSKYIDM